MKRNIPKLQKIDNDQTSTEKNNAAFLYHLQKGLLLALREKDILNASQYRFVEKKLKQQSRLL